MIDYDYDSFPLTLLSAYYNRPICFWVSEFKTLQEKQRFTT